MKIFQAIIALLAVAFLGAQTLRHIYVLFVESNVSVLDKYDPSRDKIDAAKSLDELAQLYETTRKETLVHKAATPRIPEESVHNYEWRLDENESFKSLHLIRQAIEEYELHQRQLAELHFFAIAGGLVLLVGAVVYYRVEKWAGTSICLLGLIELDWATSPSAIMQHRYPTVRQIQATYPAANSPLQIAAWHRNTGLHLVLTQDGTAKGSATAFLGGDAKFGMREQERLSPRLAAPVAPVEKRAKSISFGCELVRVVEECERLKFESAHAVAIGYDGGQVSEGGIVAA